MVASLPEGQVLAMSINHRQRLPDIDPEETDEWLEALRSVVDAHGVERARLLLHELMAESEDLDVEIAPISKTPYVNTISWDQQPPYPGDLNAEKEIQNSILWNSAVMGIRCQPQTRWDRWTHLHLCFLLNTIRSRIQSCISW